MAANDPFLTPKKTSTASTRPGNMDGIRSLLWDNNLWMDKDDAFEKFSEVRDRAFEIIKGHRHSAVNLESRENFREVRREFARVNELTFLTELWACLLHQTRYVQQLEPLGKIAWIKTAWRKDHMGVNWGADFRAESVPPLQTSDKTYVALLAKLPRVQNPRPDLAYGLRPDAFDENELRIINSLHRFTVLSTNLYHTFFIVELKSATGTIEEAENQCCRGGAAMVHARMQFNTEATMKNLPLGGDPQCIAYSLAVTPSSAEMFVHWAEVRGQADIIFHMNFLKDYSLKDRNCEGFANLRHDIDNVLDWGTLQRKQDIKNVIKDIARRNEEAQEVSKQAVDATELANKVLEEGPVPKRKRGSGRTK